MQIKTAKWSYMICSALFSMTGLILIFHPKISVTTVCLVIGALTLLFGFIKILGYFSKDMYCLAFQFDLSLGIFAVILGLVMLIYPADVIAFLHFVTGVLILIDGAFKLQTALDSRRFGLNKWWFILSTAILSGLIGLLLILNPFESAVSIMRLIGLAFLVDGLQNLWVGFYTIKTTKRKSDTNYY
jgi:uncharacterized membrane protein HdeD (DUF308 family)